MLVAFGFPQTSHTTTTASATVHPPFVVSGLYGSWSRRKTDVSARDAFSHDLLARTDFAGLGKQQMSFGRSFSMVRQCSRCGASGVTVAVGLAMTFAYLDLCELHLAELLRGARPIDPPGRT